MMFMRRQIYSGVDIDVIVFVVKTSRYAIQDSDLDDLLMLLSENDIKKSRFAVVMNEFVKEPKHSDSGNIRFDG